MGRVGLWPLARAYGAVVRLRSNAYDRGWARVERVSVPVISLGNLSVGGTGKTPLVEKICRLLQADGLRAAVVSRGYRRRGGERVTVVSRGDGRGPVVGPDAAGDEPFLLAGHLPSAAVVVSPDRVEAARTAIELGAEIVVADDAFQHRRLARQIDFLVVDATNPTETGRLLPSGRLREPLDAAGRASAFLITRCDRIGHTTRVRTLFRGLNPTAPFFETIARPTRLLLPDDASVEPDRLVDERVVAFCGIGSPRFFLEDLQRLGARVEAFLPFPDHHWFTDDDLARVAERARALRSTYVITTEKDHVRLSEKQRGLIKLHRLRIGAEFREECQLLKFLRKRLGREEAA